MIGDPQLRQNLNKIITGTSAGIIFVIVASFVGALVTNFTNEHLGSGSNSAATSTIPDYDRKDSMASVAIIPTYNPLKNTVEANVRTGDRTISLKVTGTIADGYLYVKANVNGDALRDTDPDFFDAVFANLYRLTPDGSDQGVGGHLVESKSLPTPVSATSTEMLFPLSAVPYKPTFTDSDAVIAEGNWQEILNDKRYGKKILVFSSTDKGVGTIENMTIYYTCAEGSDCSINVQ